MPVGAMIEVPAAAFALEALCAEMDFFSIGSNDLLQYFMAADRGNARLAALYNPLHPSFLACLSRSWTLSTQVRERSACAGRWAVSLGSCRC